MLLNIEGHSFGVDRDNNITYNFLVDDRQLYSRNFNTWKNRLDLWVLYQRIGIRYQSGQPSKSPKCGMYQNMSKLLDIMIN